MEGSNLSLLLLPSLPNSEANYKIEIATLDSLRSAEGYFQIMFAKCRIAIRIKQQPNCSFLANQRDFSFLLITYFNLH